MSIAAKIAATLLLVGFALAISTFPKVSAYNVKSENFKYQVAGYAGLGLFVSGFLVSIWFDN